MTEFTPGALYETDAIPNNKPPTPARRMRYVGKEEGRHNFITERWLVDGAWCDHAETLRLLGARGRKKLETKFRAHDGTLAGMKFRLVGSVKQWIPEIVPAPAELRPRERETVKETLDTAERLISVLMDGLGLTAEDVLDHAIAHQDRTLKSKLAR